MNGVRYDAQPLSTEVVVECRECDLHNKDGEPECLKLNRCPLFRGYVFKGRYSIFVQSARFGCLTGWSYFKPEEIIAWCPLSDIEPYKNTEDD